MLKFTVKQLIAGCIYTIILWCVVIFGWFGPIKYIDFVKYTSIIAIPAITWTLLIIIIKHKKK